VGNNGLLNYSVLCALWGSYQSPVWLVDKFCVNCLVHGHFVLSGACCCFVVVVVVAAAASVVGIFVVGNVVVGGVDSVAVVVVGGGGGA
jgi:hypothetical protein